MGRPLHPLTAFDTPASRQQHPSCHAPSSYLLPHNAFAGHACVRHTGGSEAPELVFPFDPSQDLDLLVFDEAAACEEERFVGQSGVCVGKVRRHHQVAMHSVHSP